jgi:hypothetical protein
VQRPDVRLYRHENPSIDTHVESTLISLSGPGFESLHLHFKPRLRHAGGVFRFSQGSFWAASVLTHQCGGDGKHSARPGRVLDVALLLTYGEVSWPFAFLASLRG